MQHSARVIVAGAGVLGASAAYHLARAGAQVTVLDPARQGRATAAGAGIICPWLSAVADPGYNGLAFAAARYYPDLIAALAEDGEHDTGYRRTGGMAVPDTGLDALETLVCQRVQHHPEAGAVSRLSPREARALFPPLREGQEALHVAGGARVDGRALARALLAAAERRGATVRSDEATALLTGNGHVRGVATPTEEIGADVVVLAAGAWADDLLAPLGPRFGVPPLGVAPQRGQIVHLRLPGTATRDWPVLLPMNSYYLLAFDDERVVVGATRETGSGFDHRVTAGGLHEVLGAGLRVAPGLASATIHEIRIGFRPAAPGPLLGPSGIPGLVVGNGLGPGGLTLGPYAGRLLAQAALGEAPELDLTPFAVGNARNGYTSSVRGM